MSFELHIPEGWSQVKLSDLGEVNRGRSRHRPRDAAHLYGGPYPFVQTGDVKASKGRVTQHSQTYSEEGLAQSRLWPKGTMCITIAANIAETGILTYPACFPDSVIGFVADESKCNVYFIEYVFRLLRKRIQAQATGSVQDNINLQTLERLLFPIPALEEQNRIAAVLGELDDKIHLNYEINQTLEQMAQAIFKSWFVDFDPVKAKMNGEQPEGMDAATASLFPEKLVESELGLIPEGWEVSQLENLVDIASSKRVFAKEYLEEGVPFYRGKEITELSKGNSVTPEIYISEERYQELKDKAGAPKEGDILITSVGTIGNTYLVDSDDKFYFKDGNLTWVKDYKDEEIPYFLMEWFKSAVGKCAIENIKIGSTQQAITIKSLNGIKLVNPSNDIHNNFTNLIEPLYRKHRANIKQSIALANLRDTLLPKLLSGEIELEGAGVVEENDVVNRLLKQMDFGVKFRPRQESIPEGSFGYIRLSGTFGSDGGTFVSIPKAVQALTKITSADGIYGEIAGNAMTENVLSGTVEIVTNNIIPLGVLNKICTAVFGKKTPIKSRNAVLLTSIHQAKNKTLDGIMNEQAKRFAFLEQSTMDEQEFGESLRYLESIGVVKCEGQHIALLDTIVQH
ncbi:restriction endonuclease subunit S [Photobacterium leiognathi]|uniref:restriction endonuclease subunit S n=1 Tax=Photobacterium leiognathi TaxID=553611 RepID=UPI0029813EC5|nr:restriction endonuclease subunit S [Photobacterium leiognathi]